MGDGRLFTSTLLIAAALTLGLISAPPASALTLAVGQIQEFALPPGSEPSDVAPGTDGTMWFLDGGTHPAIGKIATNGAIVEYTLPPGDKPAAITPGPLGNMWVAEDGDNPAILSVTPAGAITRFTAGLNPGSRPTALDVGSDGSIWFTDAGTTPAIGSITSGVIPGQAAGSITEYSTGLPPGSAPSAIGRGSDNYMWFSDEGSHAVGRVNTSAVGSGTPGTITEYPLPTWCTSQPGEIIPGADSNMWVVDPGCDAVWQVTPAGDMQPFSLGPDDSAVSLSLGPLGDIYFADNGANNGGQGEIGRLMPSDGLVSEVSAGLNPGSKPVDIDTGSDGNLWFADQGSTPAIGAMGTGAPAPNILGAELFGEGEAGQPMICSGDRWSTWDGQQPEYIPQASPPFLWFRDGQPILGALDRVYVPTPADVRHKLSCLITVSYLLTEVTVSSLSPAITVEPLHAGPQGPPGPPGKISLAGRVRVMACSAVTSKVHGRRRSQEMCGTAYISASRIFGMLGAWKVSVSRRGHQYASGLARCVGHRYSIVLTQVHRKLVSGTYTLRMTRGRERDTEAVLLR